MGGFRLSNDFAINNFHNQLELNAQEGLSNGNASPDESNLNARVGASFQRNVGASNAGAETSNLDRTFSRGTAPQIHRGIGRQAAEQQVVKAAAITRQPCFLFRDSSLGGVALTVAHGLQIEHHRLVENNEGWAFDSGAGPMMVVGSLDDALQALGLDKSNEAYKVVQEEDCIRHRMNKEEVMASIWQNQIQEDLEACPPEVDEDQIDLDALLDQILIEEGQEL